MNNTHILLNDIGKQINSVNRFKNISYINEKIIVILVMIISCRTLSFWAYMIRGNL